MFKTQSLDNPIVRLRLLLVGLFICISIPLIFLVVRAYTQFQWETYYEYRWTAQHLVKDYANLIKKKLAIEEGRTFSDYQFYKVSSNPLLKNKQVTLSPLSKLPNEDSFPGLLGYFQINEDGQVSCPILPFKDKNKLAHANLNFEWEEIDKRLALQAKISQILVDKGMVRAPTSIPIAPTLPPIPPKAAKDTSKESETSRTESNWTSSHNSADQFIKRSDTTRDTEEKGRRAKQAFIESKVKIGDFYFVEGNKDYLLALRKVWMGERKIIQGFALNKRELIEETLLELFSLANFETPVMVSIGHSDNNYTAIVPHMKDDKTVLKVVDGIVHNYEDVFLFSYLKPPLEHVGLKFSTNKIPMSPASALAIYLMAAVILVVFAGMWIIYRLGLRQITLNEERLNFVSAVSHELKTPLTSIIMYSDMLREGMVSNDDKKKSYYDFIFFESERLGRLIENVLRLSKLSRNNQGIQLEYTSVDTTVDLARSKVSTLIEKNNIDFRIQLNDNIDGDCKILIDQDAFSQIVINLIDNAIKFSKTEDGSQQRIDINLKREPNNGTQALISFGVRDYGPGIDKANSAKIFDLFYRAGNEMTRTTPGTGIGLALVSELAVAMGGGVDLINHKQGAEFRIILQAKA